MRRPLRWVVFRAKKELFQDFLNSIERTVVFLRVVKMADVCRPHMATLCNSEQSSRISVVVETLGRLGCVLINNVHEENVHKAGTVVKCASLITKAPAPSQSTHRQRDECIVVLWRAAYSSRFGIFHDESMPSDRNFST
jgi:hypothetical protein